MAQDSGWPGRMTGVVAAEVRRYRHLRRLSAQQLADRCEQLGMPIPRPVLSNLENGRRDSISVAELFVLAAALNVPPLLLLAPVGRLPIVEALPGKEFETWTEALWAAGYVRLAKLADEPEPEIIDWRDDDGTVPLYHRHEQIVDDLVMQKQGGPWLVMGADGEPDMRKSAELARGVEEGYEQDLRGARNRMREMGLTAPELPADLAYIDEEPRRPRRR